MHRRKTEDIRKKEQSDVYRERGYNAKLYCNLNIISESALWMAAKNNANKPSTFFFGKMVFNKKEIIRKKHQTTKKL